MATLSTFLSKRKRLLWRSIAVVLIITIVITAVLFYLGSDANIVTAETQSPELVLVGQVFIVDLILHNNTDTEQQIVSLGLEQALSEQGLRIEETLPRYRRVDDYGSNWLEYTFAIQSPPTILPNDTTTIRLRMIATQPADFHGELTLWFKDHVRSDTITLSIKAIAHPTPWLGQ